MTPSQIVHSIAGSKQMPECGSCESDGVSCYVCGGPVARGMPIDKWMSGSFTGQTTVACPGSNAICESCCFVMSRLSPVPGREPKEGKTLGGNYRNYSHLWEDGAGYSNASKGEKPAILAFLSREHAGEWFAAIADSGQKHVLPYTPVNQPGRRGSVLFDEALIRLPEDLSLVSVMSKLLTDGATKEELERGDYRPATWQRLGRDRIRQFETEHGRTRGAWFGLALWLAQRDEASVAERLEAEKKAVEAKKAEEKSARRKQPKETNRATRKPSDRKHRSAPGPDASSVQGSPAHELLGADHERAPVVCAPVSGSGGVDHSESEAPANSGAVQLGLFGDTGPSKPVRRARVSP